MVGSKDRVVNVKNFGNDLRNKLDTIIESVCSKFSFFLIDIVMQNSLEKPFQSCSTS